MRGGDAVSLEGLSASSDFHRKQLAARRHQAEQAERDRMRTIYGSKLETNLRVVTIKGDGRCLFRALVRLLYF